MENDYWLARIDKTIADIKLKAKFYKERARSEADVCVTDEDGNFESCSLFFASWGECCSYNETGHEESNDSI